MFVGFDLDKLLEVLPLFYTFNSEFHYVEFATWFFL